MYTANNKIIERLNDTINRFKKENYFDIKYCYVDKTNYKKLIDNLYVTGYNISEGFKYYNIMIIKMDSLYSYMNENIVIFDNGSNLRKIMLLLTDDEFAIKDIIE